MMDKKQSAAAALVHHRGGGPTAEMALSLVPLSLFVFTIIAVGQMMWLQNVLESSVADAARCASVNPTLCGTANQIEAYAADQSGAGIDSSVFTYVKTTCGNRVSANYPWTPTIPFVTISVNLSAAACYPT